MLTRTVYGTTCHQCFHASTPVTINGGAPVMWCFRCNPIAVTEPFVWSASPSVTEQEKT